MTARLHSGRDGRGRAARLRRAHRRAGPGARAGRRRGPVPGAGLRDLRHRPEDRGRRLPGHLAAFAAVHHRARVVGRGGRARPWHRAQRTGRGRPGRGREPHGLRRVPDVPGRTLQPACLAAACASPRKASSEPISLPSPPGPLRSPGIRRSKASRHSCARSKTSVGPEPPATLRISDIASRLISENNCSALSRRQAVKMSSIRAASIRALGSLGVDRNDRAISKPILQRRFRTDL